MEKGRPFQYISRRQNGDDAICDLLSKKSDANDRAPF
jgi:hypothetical protein